MSDFAVVSAGKGDVVVFPPGYGHVAVNVHGRTLILSNIVCTDFKSDYSKYIELKGAAYYDTTGGFVKNPAYGNVPPVRFAQPNGAAFGHGIYDAFVQNPERFAFLSEPENVPGTFKVI